MKSDAFEEASTREDVQACRSSEMAPLIKMGAKVVGHARTVAFQMARS